MKNRIKMIGFLCVGSLAYPMQDTVFVEGHDQGITEKARGDIKISIQDDHDYFKELSESLDFNAHYITIRLAQKFKDLAKSIENAKSCDELNGECLLNDIYIFGNAVRTINDRLVILEVALERFKTCSENKMLDNKLQDVRDKSYHYLELVKKQLGLLINTFPDTIRKKLTAMILKMQSLSRADEIESALNRIGIRTMRVKSDGWFSADVGVFEHGNLLKGMRQQAIIERSPQFPSGSTTSDLRGALGKEAVKELVGDYKIHLMPKDNDLERVSLMLINIIKQQVDLQNLIGLIKIKALLEPLVQLFIHEDKNKPFPLSQKHRMPKIVIYVAGGKKKAQHVLDSMYEHFKDIEGIDRAPAFNERVTSLIYVTQGNRDDKILYPQLFEKSLVYYNPAITGEYQDYHLINPAPLK